jgi:nucleoid DNA-binding protein
MSKKIETLTNVDFAKKFSKSLKKEGFNISLEDAKAISRIFIDTLVNEYIKLGKNITFPRFGTFTCRFKKLSDFHLSRDKKGTSLNVKFVLSETSKAFFKKIYGKD